MSLTLMGPKFRFYELFLAQSDKLIEAVTCLKLATHGFPDLATPCKSIHELCAHGEAIRLEIAQELSMVSIRPPDHEDVHRLYQVFALSFNSIKGIASRLALFNMAAIPPSIREMSDGMVEMAVHVRKILEVINREERMGKLFSAVREIREEFDRFLLVGMAEVYESKPSSGAEMLETLKCAQLYDRFEEAMDRIQQNTSVLEAILLKTL